MTTTSKEEGLLSLEKIGWLQTELEAAQWIWPELQVAVTRQSKMAEPYRTGGKSSEHPTMFDTTASAVAGDLRSTLRRWAFEVACDCRSPYAKCGLVIPEDVVELAGWMVTRVVRFIPHPLALQEITAVVEQSLRTIDRPPVRVYLGECVSCGARLYGDPAPGLSSGARRSVLAAAPGLSPACAPPPPGLSSVCWRCGVEYDPAVMRENNIRKGGELLVTAREAARYVGELYGKRLSQHRIRVWHRRGKLQSFGEQDGVMLFRFRDIVDMARASRVKQRSA